MPLSLLCWNCISKIPIVSRSFSLSLSFFLSPPLQSTKILNIFHSISLPPTHTHTHTHSNSLSSTHKYWTITELEVPAVFEVFTHAHTHTHCKHPPTHTQTRTHTDSHTHTHTHTHTQMFTAHQGSCRGGLCNGARLWAAWGWMRRPIQPAGDDAAQGNWRSWAGWLN